SNGGEVICKITFKATLIAMLLLGKKKSDRDYTQRDVDFLDRVSKNLAVSLNNAMIFKVKESYYALMAEKNKTDVLARLSEGIDHEIKNPLNAIKPAAQRIQNLLFRPRLDETESQNKIREYLEMIIRNTDRIIQIMTRLRNFARPIRASGDFKLEPVPLKKLVDEAIELVGTKQFEVDGIVVENRLADDLYIFGERTSVVQVFWNLIVNAYHAIGRNGRIDINARISSDKSRVIVEVVDTGHGILPEHLDKVFVPFFTTKPTNPVSDGEQRFTGTGLGLCYVKQYVEGLGGSITCESQVGKGTSFYLRFLKADREKVKAMSG
ncbi:MAG: ATP-binding protein, partial [Candidatus Omnitrophica bacterium]|nr:ATP-binding protein [Candidatus Omnitrophota bacterium]